MFLSSPVFSYFTFSWIESISAFYNPYVEHTAYANQNDIARFSIPARQGPGDYIVWFFWQGYMDCVDVNVVSGTKDVVNRYGLLASSAPSTMVKMDHCEYTYIGTAATQCRKITATRDASQCIADCIKLVSRIIFSRSIRAL